VPARSEVPTALWVAVCAAVAIGIGSFAPWAKAFIFSRSGIQYGDGWITVVLAAIAGIVLAAYNRGRGTGLGLMVIGALVPPASLAVLHLIASDRSFSERLHGVIDFQTESPNHSGFSGRTREEIEAEQTEKEKELAAAKEAEKQLATEHEKQNLKGASGPPKHLPGHPGGGG
jgi:hypothetical protein